MQMDQSAGEGSSASDYTFEQYDNAAETRAWFEKFLLEYNGRDWRQKLPVSLSDLVTGNLPRGPNGETVEIFWYRVKYKGTLIGYADAKIHPTFNGRKVISDIWMVPKFRRRGHFHRSFPALVEYTKAVGVCLMLDKYRLYGGWFELLGFEWLCAFGINPGEENPVTFLVTRDAYKDVLRFMIKHAGGTVHPATGRGRLVFEEVVKELEREALEVSRAGGPEQYSER
jgi:hypothetical protein